MKLATKVASILLGMMFLFSTNVFAMTFGQPERLGEVFNTPHKGFIFKGASSNIGKSYINQKWSKTEKLYEKGMATFGIGEESLYVHYDDSKKLNVMFGNQNVKNTFGYEIMEMAYDITQIKTDSGLVLYALKRIAGSMGSSNWIILGRKSDSTFTKFFETDDIRKHYFPKPRYVDFNEIRTKTDTVIISYNYFYPKQEHKGEFRFKWDEATQWFGVEQVVYDR